MMKGASKREEGETKGESHTAKYLLLLLLLQTKATTMMAISRRTITVQYPQVLALLLTT